MERRAEGAVHEARILRSRAHSFPQPTDAATAAAIRRATRSGEVDSSRKPGRGRPATLWANSASDSGKGGVSPLGGRKAARSNRRMRKPVLSAAGGLRTGFQGLGFQPGGWVPAHTVTYPPLNTRSPDGAWRYPGGSVPRSSRISRRFIRATLAPG